MKENEKKEDSPSILTNKYANISDFIKEQQLNGFVGQIIF